MSERAPPPLPPGDPYQAPASNTPPPIDNGKEGSVGKGIVICLALMLFGGPALGIVLRLIVSLFSSAGPYYLYSLMWLPIVLAPILLPVIAGIWFTRRGLRKTAKGIWLGFAIAFGLLLLLVAACFGIVASNGLGIH